MKNQALVEREEFNRLKISVIGILLFLLLISLISFITVGGGEPHPIVIWAGIINVLSQAYLLLFVLGKAKTHHPRYYVITLLITLLTFLVNLTQLNYNMSRLDENSFHGLETVADSAYFVIGTISTAGTGDIYPVSQAARLLVSFQIVLGFSLVAFVLVKDTLGSTGKNK